MKAMQTEVQKALRGIDKMFQKYLMSTEQVKSNVRKVSK